jgi:hypothetical protein
MQLIKLIATFVCLFEFIESFAILVGFFCISDFSTIASRTKMRRAISKEEGKRLAREQQEM